MLANLAKTAKLAKSGDFGEMIRANKLTQLEGPHNVGENGEFGESGDFSKIYQTKGCQRNDKSE